MPTILPAGNKIYVYHLLNIYAVNWPLARARTPNSLYIVNFDLIHCVFALHVCMKDCFSPLVSACSASATAAGFYSEGVIEILCNSVRSRPDLCCDVAHINTIKLKQIACRSIPVYGRVFQGFSHFCDIPSIFCAVRVLCVCSYLDYLSYSTHPGYLSISDMEFPNHWSHCLKLQVHKA